MKSKAFLPLMLIGILLFIQCKKEDLKPTNEPNPITYSFDCIDAEPLKSFLAEQYTEANILLDIALDSASYKLTFDDNTQITLPTDCITDIINGNWKSFLTLEDGAIIELISPGTPDQQFTLNPFGVTPLGGSLQIDAPVEIQVEIEIISPNTSENSFLHKFQSIGSNLELPVLGLYPDHNNVLTINYYSKNNHLLASENITVQTSALPDYFPTIDVVTNKINEMEDGVTLVKYKGVSFPNVPFIMDNYGKVRYYFDFTDHPILGNLNSQNGISRLRNGNYLLGDGYSHSFHELSLLGEIIRTWSISDSDFSYHHMAYEKPDGNFLITATKEGSLHVNGNPATQDFVIEMDRQNGTIVQEWDLKESLLEDRRFMYPNIGTNTANWFHGNAVLFDERDNTIIVSGRLQGLVKLDYNNDVVWIMAPHDMWGINSKGYDLNNFLLKPVDSNNTLITDSLIVRKGTENHPDFEWNWSQHAPSILPNGNILLFDNGERRNFSVNEPYSRAVEYEINEVNRTVKQIWSFGKELGEQGFSRLVSNSQRMTETGNTLFCPGYNVPVGGEVGGKIIEINTITKEILFEINMSTPLSAVAFHNAERITLYPQGL